MSLPVDDADIELLALLRDDGRASVTALAERLQLSRSAVHQRLERLREAGVLRGFAPVVDSRRLGLGVAAVVLLSAGPGATLPWQTVREGVQALPHVEYAALMTGETDVLLLVRVADFEQLRGFLLEEIRRLTGARSTLTSLILDEVVHRPFLLPGD
ncbi:Lrp/AsnC family transcriptional regulator [Egicoccus halophilus]|uniref:ArsR family transcriptional regulator n=1 Tax=Egicoccus halophilus TaxID=1670830 RepID=A0A8J3AAY7_9ACTN|nr:Lrp/AsnC family transcriptional regulator [Egicoccus halophilus]GGI09327.1 ArsR family transcriptional regulator [Egicoccus halophilus]